MEQTYFNRLRIIHLALCAGVAILGIIFYTMKTADAKIDTSFSNPMSIVGISLSALVIVSSFIYTKKIKEIQATDTFEQKKLKYQSAYIIMLALIEGPVIFNLIVFQLTQNLFHLVIAGALIFNMFSKFPNKTHIAMLLNCTTEDL